MKNPDLWKPTKFITKSGKLIASRNVNDLTVSSRLAADLVADHYNTYLKKHVHGRLADLGCGRVPLYGIYKDLASDIICVDWGSSSVTNPFLDHICDLNNPLPFDNEEFDTLLLSDVLEHLKKPDQIWGEMSRVLKAGGKLILNVPFFYKIHERPHDYFRYTEFALRHFAESNRFKIIILTPVGGIPEILSDLIAKNVFYLPVIGKWLSIFIQNLCGFFIRTGPGRRLSLKTSKDFPLGYFMIAERI